MKKEISSTISSEKLERLIIHEYGHYHLIESMESVFQRGWRWRPDNGLLICYFEDYDSAPYQFDGDDFERLASFALLKFKGWTIILS